MAGTRRNAVSLLLISIIAAIMVFSAIVYWTDYREEVHRSEELARAVAKAADERIMGSLRSVDLLLQVVAEHAAANGLDSDAALAQALSLQARSTPEIDLLLIADHRGRRRIASGDDTRFLDVAGNQFFTVQHSIHRARQVVIDGPMSDGTAALRIVVSRPILSPTEDFLGVVAAVLTPDFFTEPLRHIAPTRVSTATLFNSNGVVLSRFPAEEGWLGRKLMGTPMFEGRAGPPAGIWRSGGVDDGIDHVMAWRVVERYPLVVTAGIPYQVVMATWWNATVPKLLLEVGLLLLVAYVAGLLRRREMMLEHTARDLGVLNAELERRVEDRTRSLAEEVTERRRIEAALFQAKEAAEAGSQAKSRFLAVASHDLRQPVQALNLYANVLAGRSLAPEVADIVDRVQRSAAAVATLLDTLLDISKLDAGIVQPRERPVPIGVMLERLWHDHCPAAEAAGVSLSVVLTHSWACSDPSLIERIVQNLVSNAIRYTPAGGKVLVGCRRRGDRLALQVWDTGIGIPADKQTEIFEEFTQLDPNSQGGQQGLGLGLAIVRRLAELLGHRLSLRSAPGRGSLFEVLLPVTQAPPDPVAPPRYGVIDAGERVLVVEDAPEVRDSLVLQLRAWGFQVIDADGEEAAVAAVAVQTVGGIVADFRLPGGANGIDLARRLVTLAGRPLPVVLLTGDTEPDRLREAVDSGFHLLHKPVAPEDLRRLLMGD